MKKYGLLSILTVLIIMAGIAGCAAPKGSTGTEPMQIANTRYVMTPAPLVNAQNSAPLSSAQNMPLASTQNPMPRIINSTTDGTNNYYVIDEGIMENFPLSAGPTINYNGVTPMTVTFSKTDVTERAVEESRTIASEKAITTSHSNELGITVGVETETKAFNTSAKVKVETSYKRTWGEETMQSYSTSSSYSVANSVAEELSNSISFTIGEHGEESGDYRLALFAICDVYVLLTTSRDSSIVTKCDLVFCARTTPKPRFVLDYDKAGGDFSATSTYDFDARKFLNLPVPSYEEPITVNTEMIDYTFSATLMPEGVAKGVVDFTVTGMKVIYDDEVYIYGSAFYAGVPVGGGRYNNADWIALSNPEIPVLWAGTIYWCGTQDDNDESGMGGWQKQSDLAYNGKTVFVAEDSSNDFTADEYINIYLSEICVKYVNAAEPPLTPEEKDLIPKVITTTVSANIYCETTDVARVTFDVIGIRVKYGEKSYIMGNAYYYGNPNSGGFEDVDRIYLKNLTRNILFGGTLFWQGAIDHSSRSVMCAWNPLGEELAASEAKYMVENTAKWFPSQSNTTIVIAGICLEYNDLSTADKEANDIPEIVTVNYSASLIAEETMVGSLDFTVIGLLVSRKILNEQQVEKFDFVFGTAYAVGNANGIRYNNVDHAYLKNFEVSVLFGGVMQWESNPNDNNSCGVAFACETQDNGTTILFGVENPDNDINFNEQFRITLTGICIGYKMPTN